MFSNKSRSEYDPEQIIKKLANESCGITELAIKLLKEKYPPSERESLDRRFCLDGNAGDNEQVILIYWDAGEELAKKGYIEPTKPVFKVFPAGTPPLMEAIPQYI
ncbi:hypothetical protein BM526_19220 (plasmid) [Alteromonas mediterranea]|uniref:hypothetical protein n=1 Tax=Alteromonas mediterranea TaxID=314275 RepID=UPI0009036A87|nr:hypothetical protein [Alteromonas mediterranea]APE04101.1 hypothetical protein BM526_19220 [Alteromonas mediterranea]